MKQHQPNTFISRAAAMLLAVLMAFAGAQTAEAQAMGASLTTHITYNGVAASDVTVKVTYERTITEDITTKVSTTVTDGKIISFTKFDSKNLSVTPSHRLWTSARRSAPFIRQI